MSIIAPLRFSTLAGIERLKLCRNRLRAALLEAFWNGFAGLDCCRQGLHLHGAAELLLHLIECRKGLLENPPLQGRDALEPLQLQHGSLPPLHGKHPLFGVLGGLRQHRAARRLSDMEPNRSPQYDLATALAAHQPPGDRHPIQRA